MKILLLIFSYCLHQIPPIINRIKLESIPIVGHIPAAQNQWQQLFARCQSAHHKSTKKDSSQVESEQRVSLCSCIEPSSSLWNPTPDNPPQNYYQSFELQQLRFPTTSNCAQCFIISSLVTLCYTKSSSCFLICHPNPSAALCLPPTVIRLLLYMCANHH